MELRILGPLEVLDGDQRIPLRGARQRQLLAVLVLRRGEVVSADALIDAIWGDAPSKSPANALQAQVSQLRRTLGAGAPIVTRGPGYLLDAAADDVDAVRFERLLTRARRLLDDGDPGAAAVAGEALSLWRGEALADAGDSDPVRAEAARLEELRLTALELRIDAELARGTHLALVGELEILTTEHPLREHLWAQLMLALYRSGRQAEALRAFAGARRHLVDELGIEPGPELRDLEAKVLAQDPSLAPPQAVAAPAEGRRPTNVPARLTRFVGRADDLARVRSALRDGRSVTLVGTGGAGKTRLALEVADELTTEQADGSWFVDLAPVTDETAVVSAVATALGLGAGDRSNPVEVSARDVLDQVADHLAGRSLLLVLDNCEHVIGAAAAVAERILTACRGVRILATSREALALPGEVVLPIGPLPVDEAVELFVDRARAARPDFRLDGDGRALVADVCRRLDGLPLAVELAAARTRALPVDEIAARLGDRFRLLTGGARTALPRQQTLRAVVDWSHDLLDDAERRLFARLAVFAGGFSLRAAERVCGDDRFPAAEILDVVGRLVDKSLVAPDATGPDGPRFRFLQTLASYAGERLAESGEEPTIRERHAAHFLSLAEEGGDGLRGSDALTWRRVFESDLENLRAAQEWFVGHDDAERACRLTVAIMWLWFLRGEWHEGLRWLDEAVAARGEIPDLLRGKVLARRGCFGAIVYGPSAVEDCEAGLTLLRAAGDARSLVEGLLFTASTYSVRQRDFARSHELLAEAQPLIAMLGDEWAAGLVDLFEAYDALAAGRHDDAERLARAGADRFRRVGDDWGVVEALCAIGVAAEHRGDHAAARRTNEEMLALSRALDLPAYEAIGLIRLANAYLGTGDYETADRLLAQGVQLSSNPWEMAAGLNGRGTAARRQGDPDRARRYHEEALAIYETTMVPHGQALSLTSLAWCAVDRGAADDAVRRGRQGLSWALRAGDPAAIAGALESLAGAAVAGGDGMAAARYLGAAAAYRETLGRAAPWVDRTDAAAVEARARALLGDAAFDRTFIEGSTDPGVVAEGSSLPA